jgi:hypothetical protein
VYPFLPLQRTMETALKHKCGGFKGRRQLYDGFCLVDSNDRRHDQSNRINSDSATAGCSLFWMTVQGSVPTDACVVRSIFRPQSQMPMEDAFCMMTFFNRKYTVEALYFNSR